MKRSALASFVCGDVLTAVSVWLLSFLPSRLDQHRCAVTVVLRFSSEHSGSSDKQSARRTIEAGPSHIVLSFACGQPQHEAQPTVRVSDRPSMNPFRVLQAHRNFRLFWIGQTVSLVGTWMQQVGQGWLALQLSNSAFIVGVVSAASSLPILLFSLYAGVIVYRRDKLRLVMVAQILLSLQSAVLWWLVWSGRLTIPLLVCLALLNGLISAVEIPARQSMIVDLVGRQDVVDAIALNSGGFNLARIVGPSIAAAVIAGAGLAWCFGINALSYIAVIGCLAAIHLPKFVPAETVVAAREGLKEGIAYMRSRRDITGIMGVIAIYAIFGLQYLTMMPVIARDVLHTGAGGYGLFVTLVGIGAVSGALALAALSARIRRGRLFAATAFAFP